MSSPSTGDRTRSQNGSNFPCGCRRCADVLVTTNTCKLRLRSRLPGRLYVVRATAIQRRLIARSDTKIDSVELVTFDVGAAARQQKRSLSELHYLLRSLFLMMMLMTNTARAPPLSTRLRLLARARSCARSHVILERDASATVCFFFFAPDVATVVSRNLVDRCSWLPFCRRNAPRQCLLNCRPRKLDIHSFISAVAPVAVGRKIRDGVTSCCHQMLRHNAPAPKRATTTVSSEPSDFCCNSARCLPE